MPPDRTGMSPSFVRDLDLYGTAEATFRSIASAIGMIQAGGAVAALPDLKPYH